MNFREIWESRSKLGLGIRQRKIRKTIESTLKSKKYSDMCFLIGDDILTNQTIIRSYSWNSREKNFYAKRELDDYPFIIGGVYHHHKHGQVMLLGHVGTKDEGDEKFLVYGSRWDELVMIGKYEIDSSRGDFFLR